jgi:hypothetical protein
MRLCLSFGLLHLAGVSINDTQRDGVEQNGIAAITAQDMYQRSDGSTGTVIPFVVSPDLNNVINAPDDRANAYGTFAFPIPNT